MNNEITWSDLAFKNLGFVKNKVIKNMVIIAMNRENNDPKFCLSYNKIEPSDVCNK